MKNTLLILIVVFLFSCSSSIYIEPNFYFKGKFEPSLFNVNLIEAQINKIAKEKGYQVFEKDRNHMKKHTNDQEAFFIMLYQQNINESILTISNVGAGYVLTLALYANDDFTKQDAKFLSETVVQYLKTELNIKMMPIDPTSTQQ